jgi:Fic family protein
LNRICFRINTDINIWHRGNYKQVSNAVEANLADGTKQIVFRTAEPGLETQDAMLQKNGYSWIQYVSFEHEIESRKSEYYKVLMQTQRNRPGENVTEWLTFFISCLVNIQEQLMVKLNENKTEQPISQREKRILFFIQNHAGCGSGEISKKLDIALPTVKKSLADLVIKGIITKEGVGKATVYFVV